MGCPECMGRNIRHEWVTAPDVPFGIWFHFCLDCVECRGVRIPLLRKRQTATRMPRRRTEKVKRGS